MTLTEEQAIAAFKQVLANAKADVVQAWAGEQQFAPVRERLHVEYQAIERIEETLVENFRDSIRRAVG